jgi:hypothetical protein
MVQGGKMWKWDKNTIFLSPINFLQVFLSQVGKTGPGGKILYRFSSSSCPRSHLGRKGRKQRHKGKTLTQRERIFFPSTPPVKVEQLIAWPRRKQIKTQGKKNHIFYPS